MICHTYRGWCVTAARRIMRRRRWWSSAVLNVAAYGDESRPALSWFRSQRKCHKTPGRALYIYYWSLDKRERERERGREHRTTSMQRHGRVRLRQRLAALSFFSPPLACLFILKQVPAFHWSFKAERNKCSISADLHACPIAERPFSGSSTKLWSGSLCALSTWQS